MVIVNIKTLLIPSLDCILSRSVTYHDLLKRDFCIDLLDVGAFSDFELFRSNIQPCLCHLVASVSPCDNRSRANLRPSSSS